MRTRLSFQAVVKDFMATLGLKELEHFRLVTPAAVKLWRYEMKKREKADRQS